MSRKRKPRLQFSTRVLLLLTLIAGTFAAGYRSGYDQRPPGEFADFDALMKLIETIVVPDTWEALGGPSTMSPYPENISIITSTNGTDADDDSEMSSWIRGDITVPEHPNAAGSAHLQGDQP